MSPEFWLAIIGQTVVLLLALIGLAMRSEHRITKVEGRLDHLEMECRPIRGMSRAIARLEGKAAK